MVATVEDHGRGRAGLLARAVDVEPHGEVLHVADLVLGDQPRTERAEGVATLALVPLPAALDLVLALGNVVDDDVAGHVLERPLLADVAGAGADHDAELHLPIGLLGAARDDHVVVRADDAARRLHEHHRLLRDRQVQFRGMIREVEADGDELAHVRHGRAEPRVAVDHRQRPRIECREILQGSGRQPVPREVLDLARKVPDAAFPIQQSGAFLPLGSKAQQLHRPFLGWWEPARHRTRGSAQMR